MTLERVASLSESRIDDLHRLYQHEWWTAGREREDVAATWDYAEEVVGYCEAETGELIAFARVLTDHVYQALLQDVIVAESHRGRGLGSRLVEDVLSPSSLDDVDVLDLYCVPDHVSFYEQFGFTEDLPEDPADAVGPRERVRRLAARRRSLTERKLLPQRPGTLSSASKSSW